jgi:hypothetical protein
MDKREGHAAVLRGCFFPSRDACAPARPVDYNELAAAWTHIFATFDQPRPVADQCLQDFLLSFRARATFPRKRYVIAAVAYMSSTSTPWRCDRWTGGWKPTVPVQDRAELTRGFRRDGRTDRLPPHVRGWCAWGSQRYICLWENGDRNPRRARRRGGAPTSAGSLRRRGKRYGLPAQERPLITRTPLLADAGYAQLHAVMAFSLFSGDQHFGVLLATRTGRKAPFAFIGLQLGC